MPLALNSKDTLAAQTLLRYAFDCAVGASLHAFATRYRGITKLLTVTAPDESRVALARYRDQTPHSHLAGVHFYTFGSFERTVRWANQILAGNFALTDEPAVVVSGK